MAHIPLDDETRAKLLNEVAMPQQAVTEPRKDSAPESIEVIITITEDTTKKREDLLSGPQGMEEGQWRSQWYANHDRSYRLLSLFAYEQVESMLPQVEGFAANRLRQYLMDINHRHPADIVMHLLTYEPQLMLSNLNTREVTALYTLCSQLESYERHALNMTGLRMYAAALLSVK